MITSKKHINKNKKKKERERGFLFSIFYFLGFEACPARQTKENFYILSQKKKEHRKKNKSFSMCSILSFFKSVI